MRPILLHGHERPITFLKYNRDGDLLFTCGKDRLVTLWWSDNGERIGTYQHEGSVWSCDVSIDSSLLLTGSADNQARLWEVQSGIQLCSFPHTGPVRSVAFDRTETRFATATDPFMKHPSCIQIFELAKNPEEQSTTPILTITPIGSAQNKINQVLWGPMNDRIFAACDDKTIRVYDPNTGDELECLQGYSKPVNSIAFSHDDIFMISSSSDMTARMYDVKTLRLVKTFTTDKPVNAAAISPLYDDASNPRYHVLLGGGQEARDVTTTSAKVGKFDVQLFHMIHEDNLGSIKGHFGPVNTLAFHPDGRSYCSGSEDGYIRLHHFDPDYFGHKFD
eukprot:GILI01003175.1.p1 GENE.GILI01003175.1~~GILI01003175.1.p1  ORF type:complete len:334 (-),score=70.85 GILI01003175.1:249-1250(-)